MAPVKPTTCFADESPHKEELPVKVKKKDIRYIVSSGFKSNCEYKCLLRDQFLSKEKLNQTHSKGPEA